MSSPRKRNAPQAFGDEESSGGNTRIRKEEEPPKTRRKLNDDSESGVNATTIASSTTFSSSIRTTSSIALPPRPPPNNRVVIASSSSSASLASPTLAYPPHTLKPRSIPFQQPSQLITFSYTPSHVQEFTDSALRYYSEPPLGANLKYGYERWRRRDDERGRIDALLKAVLEVKKKEVGLSQIGVVAWRGIMTKILTAPYENRDGWEMNVMCVDGTLYFEEHLTDAKLQEKNNMDPRQRLQTYYGYAFESYSTSENPPSTGGVPAPTADPDIPPGWSGDVDTNVQWCSVVRTKLGDVRMILGGEVDCVRGKYTGKTDAFVELKTSLAIRGRYDETKFERKLLKFYFQSFLLGVPEIVVGFRTPAGVVSTVQSFKTIQLPRLVRGKPEAWDPLVCIDWGYQVLTLLRGLLPGRKEGQTRDTDGDATDAPTPVHLWRVKFVPGSGIQVEELDEAGIEEVQNGEDRVGFLPRWYWDEVNTVSAAGKTTAAVDRLTPANMGWNI